MGKRIGSILISKQLANSIYLIGWSSEEGRKIKLKLFTIMGSYNLFKIY